MSLHVRTRLCLLAILALEAALTVGIPLVLAARSPNASPSTEFLRGLLASQPMLLAIWVTLGPGPFSVRGFHALNGLGVLVLAHLAAGLFTLNNPLHAIFPFVAWGGLMLLAALVLLPCGMLRFACGLHLVPASEPPPRYLAAPLEHRDGLLVRLGNLFWLLTIVALLGVVGGSLMDGFINWRAADRNLDYFPHDPRTLLILALPAILAVPAVLHVGWRISWTLMLVPCVTLESYFASTQPHEMGEAFAFTLGTLVGIAAPLYCLTRFGWHLTRNPARALGPRKEKAPGKFRRYGALLLLLGVHPLAAGVLALLYRQEMLGDFGVYVCIGVPLLTLHPAWLAVWAALARAPLRVRFPLAVVAEVSLCFFWSWVFKAMFHAWARGLNLLLAQSFGVLMVLFLVLFAVCQFARVIFRLRLLAPGEHVAQATAPTGGESQFGLRDLFLWTFGTAVILAICRLTYSPPQNEVPSIGIGFASAFLLVGFVVACLAGPMLLATVAAVLYKGQGKAWFLAAQIALLTSSLLFGLYGLFVARESGNAPDDNMLYHFLGVALYGFVFMSGALATYLIPLFVLRGLGWRIVRLPGTAPPASVDSDESPATARTLHSRIARDIATPP